MLASITVAQLLGIQEDKIRAAVKTFSGVKRRFEMICKSPELVYIDDYAHHPEELRALINGAKELYPGFNTTIIFQPHLFTRTRDFSDGFAEVLSLTDETVLLPIYPARELPIEGVSSEMISQQLSNANTIISMRDLPGFIKNQISNEKKNLIITAGAGDIDTMIEPIKKLIEEHNKK
jgi:UDP-N-acetylmuramate--alanine ligase